MMMPGIGTGYLPCLSGITGAGPLHREVGDAGGQFVRESHNLLEGDLLGRVGGHAAHVRHQAGLHRPRHFVVRLILSDGLQQVLPLQRVGILLRLRDGPDGRSLSPDAGP